MDKNGFDKTKNISELVRGYNMPYSCSMSEIEEDDKLKAEEKKRRLLGVVAEIKATYSKNFRYEDTNYPKEDIENYLNSVKNDINNGCYWDAFVKIFSLEACIPLMKFLPQPDKRVRVHYRLLEEIIKRMNKDIITEVEKPKNLAYWWKNRE